MTDTDKALRTARLQERRDFLTRLMSGPNIRPEDRAHIQEGIDQVDRGLAHLAAEPDAPPAEASTLPPEAPTHVDRPTAPVVHQGAGSAIAPAATPTPHAGSFFHVPPPGSFSPPGTAHPPPITSAAPSPSVPFASPAMHVMGVVGRPTVTATKDGSAAPALTTTPTAIVESHPVAPGLSKP